MDLRFSRYRFDQSNLNTASREEGGGLSRTVNHTKPPYRTELR